MRAAQVGVQGLGRVLGCFFFSLLVEATNIQTKEYVPRGEVEKLKAQPLELEVVKGKK